VGRAAVGRLPPGVAAAGQPGVVLEKSAHTPTGPAPFAFKTSVTRKGPGRVNLRTTMRAACPEFWPKMGRGSPARWLRWAGMPDVQSFRRPGRPGGAWRRNGRTGLDGSYSPDGTMYSGPSNGVPGGLQPGDNLAARRSRGRPGDEPRCVWRLALPGRITPGGTGDCYNAEQKLKSPQSRIWTRKIERGGWWSAKSKGASGQNGWNLKDSGNAGPWPMPKRT